MARVSTDGFRPITTIYFFLTAPAHFALFKGDLLPTNPAGNRLSTITGIVFPRVLLPASTRGVEDRTGSKGSVRWQRLHCR